MSLPLKTLSLRAFHKYHNTHGTGTKRESGIPRALACHRTWSRLLYIESLGKEPGECGISARAQAWTEGGHWKSRWLIVSLSALQRGQLRSFPQWRLERASHTGMQLERACQIKCLIFFVVFSFHALAWSAVMLGSRTCSTSFGSSVAMARSISPNIHLIW